MTISNELMMAVLALDSYNQGYAPAVSGVGNQIGNATRLAIDIPAGSQAAGFYAAAYTLADGQTVISYRGSDDKTLDILNGYGVGAGSPDGKQASLAIQFYQSVTQQLGANVVLTGHSLGGGLAGLVADLYGKTGLLFDQMPFQLAAQTAYDYATLGRPLADLPGQLVVDEQLRQLIYGDATPWLPSTAGLSLIFIPAASYAPYSNWLATIRPDQAIPTTQYLLPDDVASGWSWSENAIGQRHDATLIVLRMFADGPQMSKDWQYAARYFFPALWNHDVAKAAGIPALNTNAEDFAGYMRNIIAYSVIDDGTKPFGDAAVRALFDDANELGQVIHQAGFNKLLNSDPIKQDLANILVQYAGDLAVAKSVDDGAKQGVFTLSDDGTDLKAEFRPDDWESTAATGNFNIIGRNALKADLLNPLAVSNASDPKFLPALNKSLAFWGSSISSVTLFDAATGGTGVDLDGSTAATAFGGAFGGSILVGGTGDDTLSGGKGNDLLIGGDGTNTITGGGGNDIILGGSGDDTYKWVSTNEGLRGVWFIGGGGNEIADYYSQASSIFTVSPDQLPSTTALNGVDVTNGNGVVDHLFGIKTIKLTTSQIDTIDLNAAAQALGIDFQSTIQSGGADAINLEKQTDGAANDNMPIEVAA